MRRKIGVFDACLDDFGFSLAAGADAMVVNFMDDDINDSMLI